MIWILIVGVVWMCLVAAVVFLLCPEPASQSMTGGLPVRPRTGRACHFHFARMASPPISWGSTASNHRLCCVLGPNIAVHLEKQ